MYYNLFNLSPVDGNLNYFQSSAVTESAACVTLYLLSVRLENNSLKLDCKVKSKCSGNFD